jgi:hypothetical protein
VLGNCRILIISLNDILEEMAKDDNEIATYKRKNLCFYE